MKKKIPVPTISTTVKPQINLYQRGQLKVVTYFNNP